MSGRYSHTHTYERERKRERDVKGLSGSPNEQKTDLRHIPTGSPILTYQRIINVNQCSSHIWNVGQTHPNSSNMLLNLIERINRHLLIAFIWHHWWLIFVWQQRNGNSSLRGPSGVLFRLVPDYIPTFKKVPRLQKNSNPAALCHKQHEWEQRRERGIRRNSSVKNIKIRSRKVQASLTASSKNIC